MWQSNGFFKSVKVSRLIHFFSLLIILTFSVPAANAAGYTCSTKTYTSCNSGYYLSSGQCKSCTSGCTCAGGTAQPVCAVTCSAGYYKNSSNTCSACSTLGNGYYCPGGTFDRSSSATGYYSCTNKPSNSVYVGTSTSNSCPWSCNAGYYGSSANGNTSCADCGNQYFCTGGTHRQSCASLVPSSAPAPDAIRTLSNGSWSDYEHGIQASDCSCDWYLSDDTRIQYLNQTACQNGPSGNNYTHYYWCRTGYYASDPLNFNEWYNSCKACTNKPANSHYTSYSTPSTMYAVESNCPWTCDDGYYQSGSSCVLCEAGYKCTGGVRSQCTSGQYQDTTGQSSCKACPAAKQYSSEVTSYSSWSSSGVYTSPAHCFAWFANTTSVNNGTIRDMRCTYANGDYGIGGGACQYYAATCKEKTYSASGSAFTGQVSYDDVMNYACQSAGTGYWSAAGSLTRTQCPASYRDGAATDSENNCVGQFSKSGSQQEPGAIDGCASSTVGTCSPGSCNYTKKYSGTIVTDCTPENCIKPRTCNSCSANRYKNGNTCPACSGVGDGTYTKSDGGTITSAYCYKDGQTCGSQVNGSTPANCYSVTAWNSCSPTCCTYKDYYSATDTTCSTWANCTKTAKTTTGKSGYYGYSSGNGEACSSCSTATDSKYTLSATGSTQIDQCYLTLKAGQQVASIGAGASNCAAGRYCTSTANIYKGTAGGTTMYTGTACAVGSYSTGGTSTCAACGAGKTTPSTGTTAASSCTACTAIDNVNEWATPSWSANTVSNLCTVSTCKAGAYKNGNACPVCGDNTYSSAGATSCTSCLADNLFDKDDYKGKLGIAINIDEAGKTTGQLNDGLLFSGFAMAFVPVEANRTYYVGGFAGKGGFALGVINEEPVEYTRVTNFMETATPTETLSVTTPNGAKYLAIEILHMSDEATLDNVGDVVASNVANMFVKTGYATTGDTVADHDSAEDCKITCAGGSYLANANDTTCTDVGIGNWAAASLIPQGGVGIVNTCQSPMTTIGYGAGADEAADCGRVLHVGNSKIYLRSEKKTEKNLHVLVDGKIYYGSMGVSSKNGLKIKSDGVTYTVYDDTIGL